MDIEQDRDIVIDTVTDSAYVSADSKRNSESSLMPSQITSMPRFESPRPINPTLPPHTLINSPGHRGDTCPPAVSNNVTSSSVLANSLPRSATLPAKLKGDQPRMISCAQFEELTETISDERLLVLDIRSSQNFSASRITGALNLCIPTTLLKRPSFNIQKLQQTFQSGPQSTKFSSWRDMQWIVVYDGHASDRRDAVTAQNMIKKFTNEGYSGNVGILRGGFTAIMDSYPELVDQRSAAELSGTSSNNKPSLGLAPVIGGVSLPGACNDINPFFSNIRQNMDLADGVGQFDIARPNGLESPTLPHWLRDAASKADHGKKVSDKFLRIEQEEQSRMKSAYAAFNPHNSTAQSKVQLCGVEMGGKNRYKDILPFEHSRVRLAGKSPGGCDYINASHLSASGSNKRYIASQGPLPATFEDFWSVIWEQDVRVVVMLTAESEGGQLKCHPYWKCGSLDSIKLTSLSEKKVSLDIDKYRSDSVSSSLSNAGDSGRRRANTTTTFEKSTPTGQSQQAQGTAPYVTVRKFALSHNAYPFAPIREITHLHFAAWPDFGTPAQPSHLLALVELANVIQRAALPVETPSVIDSTMSSSDGHSINWYDEPEGDSEPRPMLVHCSAGCGRTGTFCTVDSVIDMMKRQRHTGTAKHSRQDAEGDMKMSGVNTSVSPKTQPETQFQFFPMEPVFSNKNQQEEAATLDTSWVNNEGVDLIQKTVEDFRQQRLSMVQSLRQYVLCYETILEWTWRTNGKESGVYNRIRLRSGSLQQIRPSN